MSKESYMKRKYIIAGVIVFIISLFVGFLVMKQVKEHIGGDSTGTISMSEQESRKSAELAIKKGDSIETAGGKGAAQKASDEFQKAYDIYKKIDDEPGMSNMSMKLLIMKKAIENESTPGTLLPPQK